MSKFLIVLLMPVLFSCDFSQTDFSDEKVDGTTNLQEYAIGDTRKASRNITGIEREAGLEICRAMANMRNRLASGDRLTFNLGKVDCSRRTIDKRKVTATVVTRLGQSPELSSSGSSTLYFADLFTDTHAMLKSTCDTLLDGKEVTDTYGSNPVFQIRFRSRTDGKWIQIYEFDRNNTNKFIYSAKIYTDGRNVDLEGQTLTRMRASGCPNSRSVQELIQELAL